MRFVVLLLGFIGILLTAAGGVLFVYFQPVLDMLKTDWDFERPEIKTILTWSVDARVAGLFLWIAAGYGLLGVLMAFLRRGKQGGALMLIPVLGAGLLNPA